MLMRCLPCVKGGGPSFAWWRDCLVESSSHCTIPQSLRDSSLYTREPFASVSDKAINNNLCPDATLRLEQLTNKHASGKMIMLHSYI